jgi:hypothetical protein
MSDEDRPLVKDNHISAFEIDPRISLEIEYELAVNLGKLVLESETKNTALLALGHQLRNLSNNK